MRIILIFKSIDSVIGMVTLPMTFITNTPIECTIHQDLWFSDTFSLPNTSAISSSAHVTNPDGEAKSASVVRFFLIDWDK